MFGIDKEFIWIIVGTIFIFAAIQLVSDYGKTPILCINCMSKGIPKSHTPGSIFIEIILWCCLIIPGLVYSIWRISSRHGICSTCGSRGIIPLESPLAKKMMEEIKK